MFLFLLTFDEAIIAPHCGGCTASDTLAARLIPLLRGGLRPPPEGGTSPSLLCCHSPVQRCFKEAFVMGRGILLWLLGVPIPVILLLALVWH